MPAHLLLPRRGAARGQPRQRARRGEQRLLAHNVQLPLALLGPLRGQQQLQGAVGDGGHGGMAPRQEGAGDEEGVGARAAHGASQISRHAAATLPGAQHCAMVFPKGLQPTGMPTDEAPPAGTCLAAAAARRRHSLQTHAHLDRSS